MVMPNFVCYAVSFLNEGEHYKRTFVPVTFNKDNRLFALVHHGVSRFAGPCYWQMSLRIIIYKDAHLK